MSTDYCMTNVYISNSIQRGRNISYYLYGDWAELWGICSAVVVTIPQYLTQK